MYRFSSNLREDSPFCATIRLPPFYSALEAGEIKEGMVLIFRYQGPKGAPGMPEVSTPIL